MQRALSDDPSRRFLAMEEIVTALATFDAPVLGPTVAAPTFASRSPSAALQPTPLSAYSTVPSQDVQHGPPSFAQPQVRSGPPPLGSAPPPTGLPPAGVAGAPPMAMAMQAPMHPAGHTLASSGQPGKSRLGLALALAGGGLLALAGVGALGVYSWMNREDESSGPSAATSASAKSGTNATPVVPTPTTTTATAMATSTANTTPTGTATATGGSRSAKTLDAGIAPAIVDAGAAPAVADAGETPNAADASAPPPRSVTVMLVSASYPMTEMSNRGRALQPAIQRCVRQGLPLESKLAGIRGLCFVSPSDGTIRSVSLSADEPIPDSVKGCVDSVLRSQIYPKPDRDAPIVTVSISIR
jgi:hypothetical protein